MKFFKASNREHPHHELPTVVWDPANDRALFEFMRGPSGFLEFETSDPALIAQLKEMGYGYEVEEPVPPPTVKTMVMQEEAPPKKRQPTVSTPKVAPIPSGS
jgi:hypothetical protein